MKISNPKNGYEAVEKAVMEQMETLYGFMNESILVRIGRKYSRDDEYIYSTELLINDGQDYASDSEFEEVVKKIAARYDDKWVEVIEVVAGN